MEAIAAVAGVSQEQRLRKAVGGENLSQLTLFELQLLSTHGNTPW